MHRDIQFESIEGSVAIKQNGKCIGNITKAVIRGVVVGYKAKLKGYEHHAMTLPSVKEWVRRHA